MRRILILLPALLAGCSSFKLGAVVYCPYGQACAVQVVPVSPTQPASPVKLSTKA